MNYWLINHNWVSFSKTTEYCGFLKDWEQKQIKIGDKIVYYGDGYVLGLFEATALVINEFNGWQRSYPYQVRIKFLVLPNNPIKGGAKVNGLKVKIFEARNQGRSPNIVALSKMEFEKIKDETGN